MKEKEKCDNEAVPADAQEKTNLELWGLYNIQKSAYLNVLYYGARATTWAGWNMRLHITASALSLAAVTGLMTLDAHPFWKWTAAIAGAIAGICAALVAIMGHAEKISRFEKLHFAYYELFKLAELAAMDIRRSGLLTEEQLGAAKTLNEIYSRLGQMDDPDFKEALRNKCQLMVKDRFPKDQSWYAGSHEDTPSQAGTTATP
jgi:hypothetical protein